VQPPDDVVYPIFLEGLLTGSPGSRTYMVLIYRYETLFSKEGIKSLERVKRQVLFILQGRRLVLPLKLKENTLPSASM
jgi:hypothetical protein